MFSDTVTFALIAAAKANGLDPAALLALVEVETGGRPFEADNRTPQFLYERHVAYREAGRISDKLLAAFTSAGLAIPRWDRASQYKDQRTSAQRLDLMARARAIDAETALRSASWGLGQTMGNLAPALGFASAGALVAHQTGSVAGQIDCLLRELKRAHLIEPLNGRDWRHVARLYNGPGYAANRYDERLADACKRWSRRLDVIAPGGVPRAPPAEQSLSPEEVRAIQCWLRRNGYPQVGLTDGLWGASTMGAIAAFQAHEGLPVSGHYDAATRAALATALARPVARERAEADAGDLQEAGSTTVRAAGEVTAIGRLLQWIGLGGAGAAGADQAGALDRLKDGLERLDAAREAFGTLSDLAAWAAGHWWILALAAGFVIAAEAQAIVAARLADHRSGVHAGR